jgi:hypothetical protein
VILNQSYFMVTKNIKKSLLKLMDIKTSWFCFLHFSGDVLLPSSQFLPLAAARFKKTPLWSALLLFSK